MIKEWFSVKELEGLKGLPTTAHRVREKAKRENWQSRNRKGKGGGKEYSIKSLPWPAQCQLQAKLEGRNYVLGTLPNECEQTLNKLAAFYKGEVDAMTVLAALSGLDINLAKHSAKLINALNIEEASHD